MVTTRSRIIRAGHNCKWEITTLHIWEDGCPTMHCKISHRINNRILAISFQCSPISVGCTLSNNKCMETCIMEIMVFLHRQITYRVVINKLQNIQRLRFSQFPKRTLNSTNKMNLMVALKYPHHNSISKLTKFQLRHRLIAEVRKVMPRKIS